MHRTTKRVIGDDFNKIREYETMPGRIYALAFSADGSLFAAGSSLDGKGEVRVYQTADGKVVSKLTGIGPIYAVSFRPDGQAGRLGRLRRRGAPQRSRRRARSSRNSSRAAGRDGQAR